MCSASMASSEEEAWYFDGAGIPAAGWKEGAVGLRVDPFTRPFVPNSSETAIGAMLDCLEGLIESVYESDLL